MKTILVDAVFAFVSGEGEVFFQMQKALDTFPNRKIILTNAHYADYPKYNLDKMPYEVFTLEHNPEKKDPKFFEMMLKHYNLSKDDVLYFEHSEEAVRSAESVGIKSYYYDNEKKDLEALKKFLEENL